MDFFSQEIIGAIMIGCMLFAIFIGFPISFTLIFLGLAYDNDGEYTRRRSTFYIYGNSHGTGRSYGAFI
jgi:TRAP-type mannitol/chloroaromatic compound transport system permease large subunit